ncbi:competence protein CoiA family protein [Planktothrix mougeotii]|uniref:GIY-YIG nuclease family protein n=1 Tax=Planktothrix mougeotii LEGE 06226 TaxID=1828728 RepID=A0ABR9UJV5_9CYAN|nr:competence protein CoiA family protein [Planktothrix mougeotii]MBE9146419.1 GIY-YIG nuclease family protein [Planktothrix mougeotii LEGE 06226]
MWLNYGIDADKSLISIDEVGRGKTRLKCPYCDGTLTAKKGEIKIHHFAHSGETCREVNREGEIPYLPLYDSFNIGLTGKEFQQLKDLWNRYGIHDLGIYKDKVPSIFIKEKLLEFNRFRGLYQFTKLGKIPVCGLSLNLFNQVQEPLLLDKFEQLDKIAREAYFKDLPTFNQFLVDLQIYQAEYRKILSKTLYYLQININDNNQKIYKIGVTQRDIEARVIEIKQNLSKYLKSFTIQILGTWEHRGNVEKYFKYKYSKFHFPIDSLTEYYAFPEPEAKAVLSDLRRMKTKILSPIEQDILAGKPSELERMIAENEQTIRHSQAIKLGMERAKQWGQHVGRPPTPETTEEFLAKPSSQKIIAALKEGLSLRKAAEQVGVSVNTVRKVKALIEKD